MTTLLLYIAPGFDASEPGYEYVLTHDGETPELQGYASATKLSAHAQRGAEVVVVLSARAVSWHRVPLPPSVAAAILSPGADSQRVRAVLAGAMEEQLLEDPDGLHFAVFAAQVVNAAPMSAVWVASCDRQWLQRALEPLRACGCNVTRIVAEAVPVAPGTAVQVHVTGPASAAQMVMSTEIGVCVLPLGLSSAQFAALNDTAVVYAEPLLMAAGESVLGATVQVQTQAQRWLHAARSPWNLAQLEFGGARRQRAARALKSAWQAWTQAPRWKPVRWGLGVLLVTQVLAINAMAWSEKSLLEQKRKQQRAILQSTFPLVSVVLDAPLQMQREVAALAQSRGGIAEIELVQVLVAVDSHAPAGAEVSAIELTAHEMRLQAKGWGASEVSALNGALASQGLAAHATDGFIIVQHTGAL